MAVSLLVYKGKALLRGGSLTLSCDLAAFYDVID
jgi:hypothetical protein